MRNLFKTAIYVNASSDRLHGASRGSKPSIPITEKKRWATGRSLLTAAQKRGEQLPIIFAQYSALTFWAIARDVTLHDSTTDYQFTDLRPLHGYRRSDLIVESTGSSLPDEFIRSYAIVRTPDFLTANFDPELAEPPATSYIEGARISVTVTAYERNPHARRKCLQHYGSSCFVCGLSFGETYGEQFAGRIHVHHLKPVSRRGGEYRINPIRDLRPVCPNCHSMLHSRGVPLSISELKTITNDKLEA